MRHAGQNETCCIATKRRTAVVQEDEVEDGTPYDEDPWEDDWDWEWPEEPQITYREAIDRLRSLIQGRADVRIDWGGQRAFHGTMRGLSSLATPVAESSGCGSGRLLGWMASRGSSARPRCWSAVTPNCLRLRRCSTPRPASERTELE